MLSTTFTPISPQYLTLGARMELRRSLQQYQYVQLPNFFNPDFLERISANVLALETARKAKKFVMPGYNTPRYMHTIGGAIIRQSSPFLISLYESDELRSFLADIVEDEVHHCTHPNEFMVMHFLENIGATHGWHLDDPCFALVLVVEAPPPVAGGLLEFIPHWKKYLASSPDSDDLDGLVRKLRSKGLIQRRYHPAGHAFLIRASEALHRVTPFQWLIKRRVILNLAYQNSASASYGETASLLYD